MNFRMPSTATGKIATTLIVALVTVGTAFVSNIGGVAEGNGMMTRLFMVFFGAIITLQVIPGLLLIAAMIRGISSLTAKDAVKETAAKE